ncbi:hypothetical protein ACKAV7_014637 [Fusarium commune]
MPAARMWGASKVNNLFGRISAMSGSRRQQRPIEEGVEVVDCDILIIDAGAAGLAAAAAVQDLRVILVEKEKFVGGTTFKSGGCIWMPNNFLMREHEGAESKTHRGDAAGDSYSLRDRRLDAFLTRGPEMVEYFRDQGFRWMATPSKFPDYPSHLEG